MLERMALDESGFPQPTGELEELEADSLVLALGQETDLSFLDRVPGLVVSDGVVEVGPDMMTGSPGIFAGGDMVPFERSVTVAVGHGKRAARNIDAWLSPAAPTMDLAAAVRPPLATFDALNPWYYSDADRTHRPLLEQKSLQALVHGTSRSPQPFDPGRGIDEAHQNRSERSRYPSELAPLARPRSSSGSGTVIRRTPFPLGMKTKS